MTVEKEFTTPFGIALIVKVGVSNIPPLQMYPQCVDLRCEDAGEEQNGLGVCKSHPDLFLVEGLVFNTRFIPGDSFNGNKPLPVVKKSRVGWGIGEEEPNDERPYTCSAAKLPNVRT